MLQNAPRLPILRSGFLAISCCAFLAASVFAPASTVYVMVGADTSSVVNTGGGNVADSHENEFDMEPMSGGVFPTLMSDDYRNARLDSTGHPIVFTWYMLTGGWHHQATNVDAVAATRVYQETWSEESARHGDEIALHFHHFAWSGSAWVMAPTFAEKIWDFEWSIAQLMLDNGVFPVSFRSGWNYMDNPYQQELERWIPFRLEGGSWMSRDVPYHPSPTDYRSTGSMRGWEVRHRYLGGLNQATVDRIFQWASEGQDQVTCWWSHQYESGFLNQIDNAHQYLENADASYPGVEFRYVTARDGMRQWQGSSDIQPPRLELSLQNGRLRILSGPDVYQSAQPFVAARTYDDEYIRLDCTAREPGEWLTDESVGAYDRIGVAVCDDMGNVALEYWNGDSRRWSTQSEFGRMARTQTNHEQGRADVRLVRGDLNALAGQTESNDSTPNIERAYWIGQTFAPTQPEISGIRFGANVASSSAEIRVELRTVGEDGFPVLRPEALLAASSATFSSSGVQTAPLVSNGLATDGTQYTLLFKKISGDAEIRLLREGTYPGGNLTRAFSLDWIHIPEFDAQFETLDGEGQPDVSHMEFDAASYTLESARFLSQTFQTSAPAIDHIDFEVSSAISGDDFVVQLRRTLGNGQPDLSTSALLGQQSASVDTPGQLAIPVQWPIPPEDRGETLALTLVTPRSGSSSLSFARHTDDLYNDGTFFISTDESTAAPGGDLWFRVSSASYFDEGTLQWDFDAGAPVRWDGGTLEAALPSVNSAINLRFAFANNREALGAADWSAWQSGPSIDFPDAPVSRYTRIEARLETQDPSETPALDAFEIDYTQEWETTSWTLY